MTRRRYRYDEATKAMVEVGADWTDTERRAPVATEEIVYGGLGRATDGTPIDTRAKHRAYMKANGLTVADDFKGEWAQAGEARRRAYQEADFGPRDSKQHREVLQKAFHDLSSRRPPRRR